jgi:hypothetical protein
MSATNKKSPGKIPRLIVCYFYVAPPIPKALQGRRSLVDRRSRQGPEIVTAIIASLTGLSGIELGTHGFSDPSAIG